LHLLGKRGASLIFALLVACAPLPEVPAGAFAFGVLGDDEPLPGVRRIEVWGSPFVAWTRVVP